MLKLFPQMGINHVKSVVAMTHNESIILLLINTAAETNFRKWPIDGILLLKSTHAFQSFELNFI